MGRAGGVDGQAGRLLWGGMCCQDLRCETGASSEQRTSVREGLRVESRLESERWKRQWQRSTQRKGRRCGMAGKRGKCGEQAGPCVRRPGGRGAWGSRGGLSEAVWVGGPESRRHSEAQSSEVTGAVQLDGAGGPSSAVTCPGPRGHRSPDSRLGSSARLNNEQGGELKGLLAFLASDSNGC